MDTEQLKTEIEMLKMERNIAVVFTIFLAVVLASIAFNNYWATL